MENVQKAGLARKLLMMALAVVMVLPVSSGFTYADMPDPFAFQSSDRGNDYTDNEDDQLSWVRGGGETGGDYAGGTYGADTAEGEDDEDNDAVPNCEGEDCPDEDEEEGCTASDPIFCDLLENFERETETEPFSAQIHFCLNYVPDNYKELFCSHEGAYSQR